MPTKIKTELVKAILFNPIGADEGGTTAVCAMLPCHAGLVLMRSVEQGAWEPMLK